MSDNDIPKPTIVTFVVTFTSDVEKSTNFWKEVVGFETPFPSLPHWASLHVKGSKFDVVNHSHRETGIGVHLSDEKKSYCAPGSIQLSFVVDGIDKFHEYLVSRKDVEVLEQPTTQKWGGREALYKAPDGVVFQIVDPKAACTEPQPKKQKTESTNDHSMENGQPKEVVPSPFGVCHVDIPVGDLKRAEKFYTDAFGWKFQAWKHDYSMFESTSKEFPLQGGFSVGPKRFDFPFLYINTPTIKQGVDKLKSIGAKVGDVVEIPQVGFNVDFEDSEGNKLRLWSKLESEWFEIGAKKY